MTETRERCTGITKDGSQCGGKAMAGTDPPLCPFHHPDYQKTVQSGRIKGLVTRHISRHKLIPEDHLPIRTYAELIDFLNALLAESLEITSTKQMILAAMKIVPSLGSAIQAEELQTMSDRIERLEARQAGKLIPGRIIDE